VIVLSVASYVVGALLLAWFAFYAAATFAPKAFEAFLMRHLAHYDIERPFDPASPKTSGLYLRRFYLTPKTWKRKIFLHHIVRSDTDSASHDHQWRFWSFILAGYYIEHVYTPNGPCSRCVSRGFVGPCGGQRYHLRHATPGTLLRNKATHSHWVEIVRPVWSLVFIGKKTRTWGFWVYDKETGVDTWVRWDRYLGVEGEAGFDPNDTQAEAKAVA
jgi:hypothetical protein